MDVEIGIRMIGNTLTMSMAKSELCSRKANVIDFPRWSERPSIVQLEHPFHLDRGVLQAGNGPSVWKQSFLIVPVPMTFLEMICPGFSF